MSHIHAHIQNAGKHQNCREDILKSKAQRPKAQNSGFHLIQNFKNVKGYSTPHVHLVSYFRPEKCRFVPITHAQDSTEYHDLTLLTTDRGRVADHLTTKRLSTFGARSMLKQ